MSAAFLAKNSASDAQDADRAKNLLSAAQQADHARDSARRLKDACIAPGSTIETKSVLQEEGENEAAVKLVRKAIDEASSESIAGAKQRATDAYRWYWWNDRERVVEGLKDLRACKRITW